jgi:hypothetical protein
MAQYPARSIPFDPAGFAKHGSLQRIAAFEKGADSAARQAVIEYVVQAHAFSTTKTVSLVYDPALDQPGQNVAAQIRIGPSAFSQDEPWLSGIVYHELIHTPQYFHYASQSVTQIDPKRSETERLMFAVDELEAYWWTYQRRAEIGLSGTQHAEIRRRAARALIDVDESTVKALAENQRFEAARDELIKQFKAKTSAKAAARGGTRACCYA